MRGGKKKIKVLFLCTGNACRSQIAEGWARHLKGDVMEVFSAGVSPATVSRRAIEAMAEVGVDISGHRSRHVDEFKGIDFDYVVTVCDNARQQCPVFGGDAKMVHRMFEDPLFMDGTKKEIKSAMRKLRDEMRTFIEAMPESLEREGK
jgi:arsenate reductase